MVADPAGTAPKVASDGLVYMGNLASLSASMYMASLLSMYMGLLVFSYVHVV